MGLSTKDLARLSPNAQRQVAKQYAKQNRQREKRTGKGNKYNAKQTDVLMKDGTVRHFSSEKEANRFCELYTMERAGIISDLRCQVPYILIPYQKHEDGKAEQPCRYIADFVYHDGEREVVEDVKGYTDPKSAAYKLFTVKRKLMLYVWGITIKEV